MYKPCSDFLISKSNLPRLIVEINSTPNRHQPSDLIRVLLTGAAVVRFANNFLEAFKKEKSFVLCAVFIYDDGSATRYTLFQKQNDQVVCCDLCIEVAGLSHRRFITDHGVFR
jgi:hypothetical protein